VSKTLSATDAKYLIGLCKIGKLFEVQNWIASGKSLCVPADLRTSPLEIAVNTGFHRLVELIARNEVSQDVKNRALRRALILKRLDLSELLVSHGAEISSAPFIEVFLRWDPTIIRFFLDSPFAVAFGEKIRTALRPWMESKEKYPDFALQLQEQADRALRPFCFKEDLKWVSLLMWARADPRSSGPTLDDDLELDESEHTSALSAAACCENVQIMKRLKPDAKRDDVDKLLTDAATRGHADAVRYLLELGAKPNDKANGGSTALHECLSSSFRCESFRTGYSSTWYVPSYKPSKYSVSNTLETIQLLLEPRCPVATRKHSRRDVCPTKSARMRSRRDTGTSRTSRETHGVY
jgi:hypothetical protein